MADYNKDRYRKNQVSQASIQLAEVGKIPPQATDLEEAVLGAIMVEENSIVRIIDFLKPQCFYRESNATIFKAIKTLFDHSDPIDILTVTSKLKSTNELENVGGAYYVSTLANRVASAQNIEFHARIILQKYVQRKAIEAGTEIIKSSYQDNADIFELLDDQQTKLNDLMTGIMRRTEQGSAQMFGSWIKHLEVVAKSESAITGVPTTLTELDSVTRGFQKSDLIIIAGRPGSGKTSAIKPIIKGAVNKLKKTVLLFSLEMSTAQNIARLISEDTETPSNAFNSKEFLTKTDWNKLNSATSQYFGKDQKDLLIIDDTASLTINELRARSKLICSKNDVCCIIVDYLQMIKGAGENMVYQVEDVAKGLKNLAKEMEIPVIALAQLNRNVESREGSKSKIPKLSDLRSSGAIEQYADVVIMLHRPEYYGITELEDGSSSHQVAQWVLVKNRNGGLADLKARFIDYLTKFQDWSDPVPISPNNQPSQTYDHNAGLTNSTDFTQTINTKPDDKWGDDPF